MIAPSSFLKMSAYAKDACVGAFKSTKASASAFHVGMTAVDLWLIELL